MIWLLKLAELLGLGQFEGGGEGGHGMNMRAALFAGEDTPVEFARQGGIGGQNAGAARAAQGFCGW